MKGSSSLPYDKRDPRSIEMHGKRLLRAGSLGMAEKSFATPLPTELKRKMIDGKNRHGFGSILEKYYYGISPGNDSAPDFPEAGVELKSTPLKRLKKGGFSAKERLVLNIINYRKEAGISSFRSSSFLRKNAKIMLVSYEHADGRATLSHPVRIAQLLDFNQLSERDRLIIENDWRRISEKIRAGKAHELSEGDTEYLGACTKAADSSITRTQANGGPAAKPRAFAFKSGYMTVLLRQMLEPRRTAREYEPAIKNASSLKRIDFESQILARFRPYIGKSVSDLHREVGRGLNRKSKDYFAMLARRMVGVKGKKIEEFEKAEIVMKTIQLRADGMPKEDMSFPAFKAKTLIQENWDAPIVGDVAPSIFKQQLQKRFLFVVYQCSDDCMGKDSKRFIKAFFWTIPHATLESDVRKVWKSAITSLRKSDDSSLPKKSENPVSHVRPHGRDAQDTDFLPNGRKMTKRCFWLDKKFIKKIVEEGL